MSPIKQRYDFRLYMGMNSESGYEHLLVFRAIVIDEETFYYTKVAHFGVDESYKQIFLDIIRGEFHLKYYAAEDIGTVNPEVKHYSLSASSVIDRIEEAREMLGTLFGLDVSIVKMEVSEMIQFRFDGHDLNLKYGLNPKSAGSVFNIANSLMGTITSSVDGFGEVYQMEPIAASTSVPYVSERIDTPALEIIKKAIYDVNHESIDASFAHRQDDPYADLYKRFIKQLKEIKSIQEIETFEVIIGGKAYEIDDFKKLRRIDAQLYYEEVTGTGIVRYHEKILKSKPNIYVVVLDVDGRDCRLYLDINHARYEIMLNVLRDNEDKRVRFKGFKHGETIVLADTVLPID